MPRFNEEILSALWAEEPVASHEAVRPTPTHAWVAVGASGPAASPQLPAGGQPGDILIVGPDGQPAWSSPEQALRLRVDTPNGAVLSRETIERDFVVVARDALAQQQLQAWAQQAQAQLEHHGLGPTNADVIRGLYGSGPPVKLPPRPTAWDHILADEV